MFIKEFLRVLCLLTFYQIVFVYCDVPMLGPADIIVKNILQCENPEQYPSYFVTDKKKVNRTHDIFNLDVKLDVDLDETVGIYINIAKWGDGGYKPNYYVLNETNACNFLFTYIKNEMMLMLRAGGRPEKCPIRAGSGRLVNYSIDYRKLPQELLYGDFRILVLLFKDGVTKLCNEVYAETRPKKPWRIEAPKRQYKK